MTEAASALDRITVDIPCEVPWDSMRGDDRVRFCGQCRLNVYNLAEMTRDEAETLVNDREERLCARFFRRVDGTIVTRDCGPVVRAIRRRMRWMVAAVVGLMATAAYGFTGGGSRGGLSSWQTWQQEPFRTIARVLPPGWLPVGPPIAGDICVLPVAPPPSAPVRNE